MPEAFVTRTLKTAQRKIEWKKNLTEFSSVVVHSCAMIWAEFYSRHEDLESFK